MEPQEWSYNHKYHTEYAKSNRSICVKCLCKIEEAALRFATEGQGNGDYDITYVVERVLEGL